MAGIARLAMQLGHAVSGTDKGPIYPPMSSQIEKMKIPVTSGYSELSIPDDVDIVIVGNSLSRGNPTIEKMLEDKVKFISGPAWLAENILQKKQTIVISGTHGKTTVSSLVTWILEESGHQPGFLIGGIPGNFEYSANLGEGGFFVVEGDEYDSAFFDKRSKFVHYTPDILVINNLEYDHADIFANLSEIITQFHHMIRTMSSSAFIIRPESQVSVDNLLAKGCWSTVKYFGASDKADLKYDFFESEKHSVRISAKNELFESIGIGLGKHNAANLAAALMATNCAGVSVEKSLLATETFRNAKRRMELLGIINGISVYDDFAHHPTAIRASVDALKETLGNNEKLIAILEPISNTMRMGYHKNQLAPSLINADLVGIYSEVNVEWDIKSIFAGHKFLGEFSDSKRLAQLLINRSKKGDKILVMSNGSVGGLHSLLINELKQQQD